MQDLKVADQFAGRKIEDQIHFNQYIIIKKEITEVD